MCSFAVDKFLTMTLVVVNLAVIQSALTTAQMEVSWKLIRAVLITSYWGPML